MTGQEAIETCLAMASVQEGYAKRATDRGLKTIHSANAKAQREVAETIAAALDEIARLRAALDAKFSFEKADWFWRVMDPDDCGDSPEEAVNRALLGRFCVCEIASSFTGPVRYGFIAPVLDPESDDEEFVHFATHQEAIDAAKARAALAPAAPTEYERKVAQMKEDFPNGI